MGYLMTYNKPGKRGEERPTKYRKDGFPLEVDEAWDFSVVWTQIFNPKTPEEKLLRYLYDRILMLPPPRRYGEIRRKIMEVHCAAVKKMPAEEHRFYCAECGRPLGLPNTIRAAAIVDGRLVERPENVKQHLACTTESAQYYHYKDKKSHRRKSGSSSK